MAFSRPNFLASEVGLKLNTVGLDAETHSTLTVNEVDENGITRKIVKQGTILSTGAVKGLVFQDIDVTGSTATTQVAASIMTGGYYINSTSALPKVVPTETVTTFASQGLFADSSKPATFTRPY